MKVLIALVVVLSVINGIWASPVETSEQQQDQGGENSGVENSPSASNPTDIQPGNSQGYPEQPPDVTHTPTSRVDAPATPIPEPPTKSTGNPNNMTEEEIYASNVRLCKLIIKEVFATVEKMPEVAPLSSPGNEANQTLILQLLNNYRVSNDLHPLRFDPRLEKVTLEALQDLSDSLSSGSDNLGEIKKRLKQSNIDYKLVEYGFRNVAMNEWDIMSSMVKKRQGDEAILFPCYTHAALAAAEGKWLIIFTHLA